MEDMRIHHNEEVEIDTKRIAGALGDSARLIGAAALVCAVLVSLYTLIFVPPMYQSSAMFYVKNSVLSPDSVSAGVGVGDLSASRELVDSCIVILNTRQTLDAVMEETGVKLTEKQLEKRISAVSVDNTEIFRVTVMAPDAQEALKIAEAIVRILPMKISGIIEGASVKIVDTPVAAVQPVSPRYAMNALIGLLAGLVLAAGFAVLRELLDSSVYSEDEVDENCRYPVLAVVPDMSRPDERSWGGKKRSGEKAPDLQEYSEGCSFAAAEAYRLLRTKLQFSFDDVSGGRVVGISGAMSGEGKSVCAVNLAYHMAQLGQRVLLIDCDVRDSSLESRLRLSKTPGLSDYLTGQSGRREIFQMYGAGTGRQAFAVITSGRIPHAPAELLSSREMAELLACVREEYDWIILDLPAVGEVSDVLAVAAMSDGMVMVIRQGYSSCETLNAAIRQLAFVETRILGIVFNGARKGSVRRKQRWDKVDRYDGEQGGQETAGESVRV